MTGTSELVSVASLPAARIAKYASLAIINCNLQIQKEADLKPTFESLYPFVLDYSTSKGFTEQMRSVEQSSQSHVKALTAKIISIQDHEIKPPNQEELEAKQLYDTIKKQLHEVA